MKRETLTHPKTYDLAARLNRSRPEALGFLTLLWDFCAVQAPRGNIGKWPNGSIARACDWSGDADEFIAAFVAAGFVDEDDEYRLLIHDWADHCERWVKAKLEKLKESIIVRNHPTEATVERTVVATTEASPPRDQTKPNQTKPKPNPNSTADRSAKWSGAFSKLVRQDLEHDDRLHERYRRAVALGAVEDTQAGLLNFLGAAERALEVADDPPAMFRKIVEERLYGHITQAQEDRANARLKRFRKGRNGETSEAVKRLGQSIRAGPADYPAAEP